MNRRIRAILALGISAALIYYVEAHWKDLRHLWDLRPIEVASALTICFLLVTVNGSLLQIVVKVFEVQSKFLTMFVLEHTAQLLNYAPMKVGTLFRAHYLKNHYALSYIEFAACFAYITFLMISCSSVMALVALALGFGFISYESSVLGIILAMSALLSGIMLLLPLKKPGGEGKLSYWISLLLSGREKLGNAKKTLAISTGLLVMNFLLGSLRIGIIYQGLGVDVPIEGYLVLGSLSYLALFAGLTPGALGIREVVLSLGAVLLGIPLELGALAALIDRAILMVYTFTVGGLCTLYLWRKSPDDFNQAEASQ